MATYFAEIDSNKVVLRVIVADQSFINSGVVGNPANWIETTTDGSLRKNYAAKGSTYNTSLDAFVYPQPFPSWTLNSVTARWEAPVAKPKDGKKWIWNEGTLAWIRDADALLNSQTFA